MRQAEIEILRYLIAHLDARDSIEGIEKWWLPQSAGYRVRDIAAALRRLQSRELVTLWESASAKPLYGASTADPLPLEAYLHLLET